MDPLIKSQLLYQLSYAPHQSRSITAACRIVDTPASPLPDQPDNEPAAVVHYNGVSAVARDAGRAGPAALDP